MTTPPKSSELNPRAELRKWVYYRDAFVVTGQMFDDLKGVPDNTFKIIRLRRDELGATEYKDHWIFRDQFNYYYAAKKSTEIIRR